MKIKILLWLLAAIITMAAAVFQRITGPTYPLNGTITINNNEIKYKLIRSIEIGSNTPIRIPYIQNTDAYVVYKRYKTNDSLSILKMNKEGNDFVILLPDLQPAGKYVYSIYYNVNEKKYYLNESDVIVRYKGAVPLWILVLHIIFMFFSLMFSNFTGITSISNRFNSGRWAIFTMLFLFIGGFIFGPIVQKYAFNEFWAGFPNGYDLTDNKVLISFIFWIISWLAYHKTKNSKWFLLASIITLIVYLIPHSLYGSELDFSTGKIIQG